MRGYLTATNLFGFASLAIAIAFVTTPVIAQEQPNPDRNVYFGDTHGHSSWSTDAFGFGNRLSPENAYRFARGEPAYHALPSGEKIQLHAPLDFYMMTDHSEMMGLASQALDSTNAVFNTEIGKLLRANDPQSGAKALFALQNAVSSGVLPPGYTFGSFKSVWQHVIDNAEKFNEPGKFTTFVAYEWTSMPDGENLHRNVIFRGTDVPDMPFSAMDSTVPEDLWSFLEYQRELGNDNLAISHNGNLSNGRMFRLVDSYGAPITAEYAKRRNENEPLHEAMQLKGTSMTHPAFSPQDEWANFELLPVSLHTWQPTQQQQTSFVREAYKFGLRFQQTIGANPFKFGLEGGGDDHSTSHTFEEDNYHGGHALIDNTPEKRLTGTIPLPGAAPGVNIMLSAGGITGLWAESNTRDAIFDAMRRKETFGSSGVRIRPRFFAGWNYPADLVTRTDWVKQAYATGVPMGGDLKAVPGGTPKGQVPTFAVHAVRDPNSAPLQRIQIIKGWTKAGEMYEQVYDVACADGGKVDPKTHRCPDNGATVDTKTCQISADKGDAQLAAIWTDPDFDMTVPAFYYMRVLENPVCRWSTHQANALGMPLSDKVPATIQERIWTSPIWYTPVGEKSEAFMLPRGAVIIPYAEMGRGQDQ
jgi:hypothetical protein